MRWAREDNDRGVLDRVLAGDVEGLLEHAAEHRSACCPGAVAATLSAMDAYGATPTPVLLDHRLSFDVRPADDFVGYAGLAL